MKRITLIILLLLSVSFYAIGQETTPSGGFSKRLDGYWSGTAATTDQVLHFSLKISAEKQAVSFSSADLKAMDITAGNVTFRKDTISFTLTGDSEIITFLATLKNGELKGSLTTNNETVAPKNRVAAFILKRKAISKANYHLKEVTFKSGKVILSGSLYLPNRSGKVPAIVYNHSSGDQQRYDGAFMADYLASRGIAVLTYDKRGDGKSTGDWKTSSFEDLADDCIAGIKYLRTIPAVNTKLIGIFGHSQGGTISPIIVSRYPQIAFNVAAAAFAVSPEEQDLFRVRNNLHDDAHFNALTIDSALNFYRVWLEVAKTGKGWKEMQLADSLVHGKAWYPWVQPPPADSWVWKWYQVTGNYNYERFWKQVHTPTLLIYGEYDEVTPVKPSLLRIKRGLKKAGNDNYKVVVIPGARHYFTLIKKDGDMWTENAPGYLPAVYKWICVMKARISN